MSTSTLSREESDASAPRERGADDGPLSHKQILTVFSGLLLAMLLAALDQTIVNTALPTIAGDLNGLDQLSWVLTAYLLTSTVGLLIYGKLGDQFGRKNIFLFAIVLFLIGSILSGVSQNITQLIIFRAVQGVGGGGLMITAQAIIADIVPPRERGKYMGLLGAVFGVSTVAGPLLGGFFTDHLSWRWCFYVNVPIGAAALIVVALVLHLPKRDPSHKPKLDVIGSVLMAAASACIVLLTTWGGTTYEWSDPIIIGLGVGFVALAALFVLAEHRASEPIMPLRLFKDSVFNMSGLIGLVIGICMFGAVGYIPTFLQMVDGASATGSGLLMLPFVFGMLITTITSGRLISSTGRYKIFPILGTAIAAIGMGLLSLMDVDSSRVENGVYMAVLGIGIGLVMQVLVLVVQNSAPARDVGAATASNTYFRQIGASIGASIVGALFTSRLTDRLAEDLPPGADSSRIPDPSAITPELLDKLPGPVRDGFINAFAEALPPIFLYLVPVLAVAFVISWFLKEKPLRTGGAAEGQNGTDGSGPGGDDTAATVHPVDTEAMAAELADTELADAELVGAGAVRAGAVRAGAVDTASPQPLREGALLTAADPVVANGNGTGPRPSVDEPGRHAVSERPGVHGHVTAPDGAALHAVLTLTDTDGSQIDTTTTDAGGSYALRVPAPGRYLLVCTPNAEAQAAGHQPYAAHVTVGTESVEHPIGAVAPTVLNGTLRAPDGTAVAGATINLIGAQGHVTAVTTTDDGGGYTFAGAAAGAYTLTAMTAQHRPVASTIRLAPARPHRHDLLLES